MHQLASPTTRGHDPAMSVQTTLSKQAMQDRALPQKATASCAQNGSDQHLQDGVSLQAEQ